MAEKSTKQWEGRTFGGGWMHEALIAMLRALPLRVLYAFVAVFVIPPCMFTKGGRQSYHFYRRRFNRTPLHALSSAYGNLLCFGKVIIDRFAMYAGKKFEFEIVGYEHFEQLEAQPEGFVMLSAHVGNYELAGYSLTSRRKRFNAVVYGGEKASIMANRKRMFAERNIRMISALPEGDHPFLLNDAIMGGEIISLPADRVTGTSRSVKLELLGKEAPFPLGPFFTAALHGLSVISVSVMKAAARRYVILIAPLDYPQQGSHKAQAERLARRWAEELERIVKAYPLQWFNYYDFWHEDAEQS